MPDFADRSAQAEWMDDPSVSYEDFAACLRDLEKVNSWTFAYRPTRRWLRQISARTGGQGLGSVVDVGSGGGDNLRMIARWAARRRRPADLTGVDLNPWAKRYAERIPSAAWPIRFVCADIFAFAALPEQRIDYVMSSLFTHHLDQEQLIGFLRWMELRAQKGWFVNDLHRHPVAYGSFKCLAWLMRWHPMVRHDGPISVARAFRRQDWISALQAAGIPAGQVEIRWMFPFRYSLVRHKA